MITGTGLPFSSVGSNSQWRTASIAAWSSNGIDRRTRGWLSTRSGRAVWSRSCLLLLDELLDDAALLRREPAVLREMQEEALGRAVEHAVDELADHRAEDLLARSCRRVDVRAVPLRLPEVALLLQNPHHRHHGGVRDGTALAERLVDVAHGGLPGPPDDLHDGELLGRERRAWRSHD